MAQVLSHRFVVGVPDMGIKVRSHPSTMIIEVKQCAKPVRAEKVKLEATAKQILSLNEWANAGTPAGLLSFLVEGGRAQKKKYYAGLFAPPWVQHKGVWQYHWDPLGDIWVEVARHFPIDTQCRDVVPLLHRFAADFMEGPQPNVQ
jgi:hypothetical protein